MFFPVVTYGNESWTRKKAECWRTDAFDLRYWRRLLKVLWTSRRSNQSFLKEINLHIHLKVWSWSWSSNSLDTWCEELTHWKRLWCWKRLKAGGGGDDRGWNGWMASPTQWTWVWASSRKWWRTGKPDMLREWGHKESDITEQLNNNNKRITDTKAEISEKKESLWIRPGERPSILD